MIDWFVQTLRSYPEIAIFLSLALGYYFGSFTYKGLGLGAVTATLIAAVIIGQLGITISGPLKPFFFLMFLFAIGYGVGPQFVRGIAQDGVPQALFAAVVCVFCLLARLCRRQDSPAMTSAPPRDSMRARRRSRRRWALRPMRSTASVCRPRKPRSFWMRCRSPMPSPTSSARSDRRSSSPCSARPCSASISRPRASATRRSTGARRKRAVPARPGTNSSCAHSASGRGHGSWARRRKKPRRCFPSTGYSSSAFAVATRSSMRRPTP